jgi:hypothetical protein
MLLTLSLLVNNSTRVPNQHIFGEGGFVKIGLIRFFFKVQARSSIFCATIFYYENTKKITKEQHSIYHEHRCRDLRRGLRARK